MGRQPVRAPSRQRPKPPSQFNAKFSKEEHFVVNASYSISPNLVPCDSPPQIETGAEGAVSRGFGRNKIEIGRLPVEHSQI